MWLFDILLAGLRTHHVNRIASIYCGPSGTRLSVMATIFETCLGRLRYAPAVLSRRPTRNKSAILDRKLRDDEPAFTTTGGRYAE